MHSGIKGMHLLWPQQNIATCKCYARPFWDNSQWSAHLASGCWQCDWSSYLQIKGQPYLFTYHTCLICLPITPVSHLSYLPKILGGVLWDFPCVYPHDNLMKWHWDREWWLVQRNLMSFMGESKFELRSSHSTEHIWCPQPRSAGLGSPAVKTYACLLRHWSHCVQWSLFLGKCAYICNPIDPTRDGQQS